MDVGLKVLQGECIGIEGSQRGRGRDKGREDTRREIEREGRK